MERYKLVGLDEHIGFRNTNIVQCKSIGIINDKVCGVRNEGAGQINEFDYI